MPAGARVGGTDSSLGTNLKVMAGSVSAEVDRLYSGVKEMTAVDVSRISLSKDAQRATEDDDADDGGEVAKTSGHTQNIMDSINAAVKNANAAKSGVNLPREPKKVNKMLTFLSSVTRVTRPPALEKKLGVFCVFLCFLSVFSVFFQCVFVRAHTREVPVDLCVLASAFLLGHWDIPHKS